MTKSMSFDIAVLCVLSVINIINNIQVTDVAIVLRLDSYEYAHNHFVDLFRCMLMLDCKSYSRATLMMMCLMKHHKHHGTPIWHMVRNNLGCINEEPCEISFSSLAGVAVADTCSDKAQYLSDLYSLTDLARQCVVDFSEDVGGTSPTGGSHIRISKKSEEVKSVGAFFADKIRRIKIDSKIAYKQTFFKKKSRQVRNIDKAVDLIEVHGNLLYREESLSPQKSQS